MKVLASSDPLWFIKVRIKNFFTFPFRFFAYVLAYQTYREDYERLTKEFIVGDVVRRPREKNIRSRIRMAPSVQGLIGGRMGKADENGYREAVQEEYAKGSLLWSFFEQHDPWVIEKVFVDSYAKWRDSFLSGFPHHPLTFHIRPYFPESIVWHENVGYGRDTFFTGPQLIERFPREELEKLIFERTFES